MKSIVNILADRYASKQLQAIWSPQGRILLERELWIAVLKAQKELGLPISDETIEAYEKANDLIDLDSIKAREKITHHDVKARIEEFCFLAGHEQIHMGMTSRDLTENVEQYQIFKSLQLIREKAVCALVRIAKRATQNASVIITARTHNVAAQPTTLGKRLSMYGQELICALTPLDEYIENYAIRGIKGAVGTQLDLLTLFDNDTKKVALFEEKILKYLGIHKTLKSVGQVYPRLLDYQVASLLYGLSSAPANFAKTLRLMAGNETASEGFSQGQVGSSAMPHKMNSRSCERINGFRTILQGYLTMLANLSGDQWNEGDVSCSVVRRVALPDSFYAIDGLFETFITILDQMEIYEAVIDRENQNTLPFLCTTTILMEAVKKGLGRESVHHAIKEHALQTVNDLRKGVVEQNDLLQRLSKDKRIGLCLDELMAIMNKTAHATALAKNQIEEFASQVDLWSKRFPEAIVYTPDTIL